MFFKKQKKLIKEKNQFPSQYYYYYRWTSIESLFYFTFNEIECVDIYDKKVIFNGKIFLNKKLNVIIIESDYNYKKIFIKKKI